MKFFTTLLVLFTAIFFHSFAYSAFDDQLTNNQINIQQLAKDTEQTESDDDEYEDYDDDGC